MWCLVPLAGPDKGTRFELSDGDSIGRAQTCRVRLPHASVSRVHARIEVRGDVWFVVDAGSSNGMRHGGESVAEQVLSDGMRLRFGEVPARFEWGAEGGEPNSVPTSREDDSEEILDEDLEFEFEAEPEAGADDGFELELEPELAATSKRAQPRLGRHGDSTDAAPAVDSSASAPGRVAPQGAQNTAQQTAQAREQLLRTEARQSAGLLRGDLSQQPGWVQALIWLVALGGLVALVWLAFGLVQAAKV